MVSEDGKLFFPKRNASRDQPVVVVSGEEAVLSDEPEKEEVKKVKKRSRKEWAGHHVIFMPGEKPYYSHPKKDPKEKKPSMHQSLVVAFNANVRPMFCSPGPKKRKIYIMLTSLVKLIYWYLYLKVNCVI